MIFAIVSYSHRICRKACGKMAQWLKQLLQELLKFGSLESTSASGMPTGMLITPVSDNGVRASPEEVFQQDQPWGKFCLNYDNLHQKNKMEQKSRKIPVSNLTLHTYSRIQTCTLGHLHTCKHAHIIFRNRQKE